MVIFVYMKKRTYTKNDKIEIFSEYLNLYKEHEKIYNNCHNVSKPRAYFGTFVGGADYGVFIDIRFTIYDENLKVVDTVYTNLHAEVDKINGEYKLIDDLPQNIKDFIPRNAIDECIAHLIKTFGENFHDMYIENRIHKQKKENVKKCEPIIKRYEL